MSLALRNLVIAETRITAMRKLAAQAGVPYWYRYNLGDIEVLRQDALDLIEEGYVSTYAPRHRATKREVLLRNLHSETRITVMRKLAQQAGVRNTNTYYLADIDDLREHAIQTLHHTAPHAEN